MESPSSQRTPRRPSKASSFARRMRSMVQKDLSNNFQLEPSSPTTHADKETDALAGRTRPENLKVFHSLEEFKDALQADKDKIIVVRWFAPWCRVSEGMVLFLLSVSLSALFSGFLEHAGSRVFLRVTYRLFAPY